MRGQIMRPKLFVALATCVALALSACAADEQTSAQESPTSTTMGSQEPATTEVPEDPSCRQAADFTLAAITSSAEQTVAGIESFASEEELGEVIFDFLFALPDEIGVDVEEACGSAQRSISELKKGLERTIRDKPEPVTDLTLAFFAIGCSDEITDPEADPAETEAYKNEVCPVIDNYFDERGFALEGGPGEPGFR
jgi:hypothetical protein